VAVNWFSAAEGALRFLHEHVGSDLASRRAEEAVPAATVLPWAESFCRLMTRGRAPGWPRSLLPSLRNASRSAGPLQGIAAYIGTPLVTGDLRLFGTLCGVAYRAKPRSTARKMQVLEAAARLLSTLMAAGMVPRRPSATSTAGRTTGSPAGRADLMSRRVCSAAPMSDAAHIGCGAAASRGATEPRQ
jgi:hypothetical protein